MKRLPTECQCRNIHWGIGDTSQTAGRATETGVHESVDCRSRVGDRSHDADGEQLREGRSNNPSVTRENDMMSFVLLHYCMHPRTHSWYCLLQSAYTLSSRGLATCTSTSKRKACKGFRYLVQTQLTLSGIACVLNSWSVNALQFAKAVGGRHNLSSRLQQCHHSRYATTRPAAAGSSHSHAQMLLLCRPLPTTRQLQAYFNNRQRLYSSTDTQACPSLLQPHYYARCQTSDHHCDSCLHSILQCPSNHCFVGTKLSQRHCYCRSSKQSAQTFMQWKLSWCGQCNTCYCVVC